MAFRWPFARRGPKEPAPVEKKPETDGFFSTSVSPPRGGASDDWRAMLRGLTIQRTASDFRAVDSGGKTVPGTAMDASDNNFKLAFNFGYSGVPEAQAAWYAAQSFIGYQMCAIIAQHWLVDKAMTMPARDAIRNGYELTINDGTEVDPKVLDFQRSLDRRFQIKANCVEFVRCCRIFGVRIALFKVDSPDPDYYEKLFNPDGVKPGSYKGISQVDPYWITPELDAVSAGDPASPDFYVPTYWRISGRRYHKSHLIIIRTCEPPDVLKPTYFYGGIPLTQRIYERVYAAERTANEAPQLALTKRANVIKTNLAAAAANQQAFEDRLNLAAYYRDNYGYKVIGSDETMEQFETSLTDLDSAIATQYQLVAAIADVPATKLMGTSPKGFNSAGTYEEASYHETLESIQSDDMEPLLDRHHLLCMRSYVSPKFGLPPTTHMVVNWNELDAETAQEASERKFKDSQTAKNYADTGGIDGVDIRKKLIADKDSGWNGLPEIMPIGPMPRVVVQPDAPTTAPNTDPGETPTPAPATTAAPNGA